jgi:hypothetical protein
MIHEGIEIVLKYAYHAAEILNLEKAFETRRTLRTQSKI